MEVVHIGKGSDILKSIPAAPAYFDAASKRHFKQVAKILIAAKILKEIHLPALEILAQNKAQLEFALRAINKKNKVKLGTGYIQKFTTGAENISVELSLKKQAEYTILQCIKQFGLDPKSEKELNHQPDNQVNLLEALGLKNIVK